MINKFSDLCVFKKNIVKPHIYFYSCTKKARSFFYQRKVQTTVLSHQIHACPQLSMLRYSNFSNHCTIFFIEGIAGFVIAVCKRFPLYVIFPSCPTKEVLFLKKIGFIGRMRTKCVSIMIKKKRNEKYREKK